jgi:hypothetical protein
MVLASRPPLCITRNSNAAIAFLFIALSLRDSGSLELRYYLTGLISYVFQTYADLAEGLR